jgi:transposase
MTEQSRLVVLSDEQWAVLGPLIDECRPRGKTKPVALRETVEAIVWRHQNGAKWRSVPSDLVPWWRAAQTFIRWSQLGVWERLLRNRVERLWARLKEWRAVATRYEKTAASFMGVLCLAAVFDWIREDIKP